MHYVAVLNDIVLAFYTHLAGGTHRSFCLEGDEIVIFDDFSPDETLFKISMDNSGGFWCLVPFVDGPGAAFIRTGGEESLKPQQMIGALDETHDT